MKTKVLPYLMHSLMCAMLVFGGIGCLATSFKLTINLPLLITSLCFWVLVGVICPGFGGGWKVILAAVILSAGYYYFSAAGVHLISLFWNILYIYSKVNGLNIDLQQYEMYIYGDVTWALTMIASVIALNTGFILTKRQSASIALASASLPLVFCLLFTNTVPHWAYLFLLMLGALLVLLTQQVRRKSLYQSGRLALLLLLPCSMLMGLLFAAMPQERYVPPEKSSRVISKVVNWIGKLPGWSGSPFTSSSGAENDYVNLQIVGINHLSDKVAMRIQTSRSGLVYLRGRSYDCYDGFSWYGSSSDTQDIFTVSNDLRVFQSHPDDPTNPYAFDALSITTVHSENFCYLPYYPNETTVLSDGMLPNEHQRIKYSYKVNPLRSDWKERWTTRNRSLTLDILADDIYCTQLPAATKTAAQEILSSIGIHENLTVPEAADRIGDYVRLSAKYDLNTPRMPQNSQDFALWFLEESSTGYCIHYATATAVLLRAAGIPARFVEGYCVYAAADQETDVTGKTAHAWVEYYLPNAGWIMLESTPEAGRASDPGLSHPTEPSTVSESTAPPELPAASTPSDPMTQTPSLPGEGAQHMEKGGSHFILGWILVLISLLLGITVLQWRIRLSLFCRRIRRSNPNKKALLYWNRTLLMAELRRQLPPEPLLALAEKAKFSQHTMTEEDLSQFEGYFHRSIRHLKQKPWWMQLVYRLVFAAY